MQRGKIERISLKQAEGTPNSDRAKKLTSLRSTKTVQWLSSRRNVRLSDLSADSHEQIKPSTITLYNALQYLTDQQTSEPGDGLQELVKQLLLNQIEPITVISYPALLNAMHAALQSPLVSPYCLHIQIIQVLIELCLSETVSKQITGLPIFRTACELFISWEAPTSVIVEIMKLLGNICCDKESSTDIIFTSDFSNGVECHKLAEWAMIICVRMFNVFLACPTFDYKKIEDVDTSIWFVANTIPYFNDFEADTHATISNADLLSLCFNALLDVFLVLHSFGPGSTVVSAAEPVNTQTLKHNILDSLVLILKSLEQGKVFVIKSERTDNSFAFIPLHSLEVIASSCNCGASRFSKQTTASCDEELMCPGIMRFFGEFAMIYDCSRLRDDASLAFKQFMNNFLLEYLMPHLVGTNTYTVEHTLKCLVNILSYFFDNVLVCEFLDALVKNNYLSLLVDILLTSASTNSSNKLKYILQIHYLILLWSRDTFDSACIFTIYSCYLDSAIIPCMASILNTFGTSGYKSIILPTLQFLHLICLYDFDETNSSPGMKSLCKSMDINRLEWFLGNSNRHIMREAKEILALFGKAV